MFRLAEHRCEKILRLRFSHRSDGPYGDHHCIKTEQHSAERNGRVS